MVRHMNRKKNLKRQGVALLEFAIILPLLLLLTFGLIEYSWMFLKSQQITNAARQGARVGARPDAVNATVEIEVDRVLNNAGILDGEYTLAIVPGDVTTPEPGEPLTVTVTVPYANIALTGVPFLPAPENLRAETTLAKEGP